MGPQRRGLDQRLENRLVDLPHSHDPHPSAKGVEDPNVGRAMAMAQAGKISPRALLGQQLGQQIERMHRRQQRQQMHAPELGGAELPARAAKGTCVPMFVDEIVGDVWLKQVEQLVGTGHGQALHGPGAYPF